MDKFKITLQSLEDNALAGVQSWLNDLDLTESISTTYANKKKYELGKIRKAIENLDLAIELIEKLDDIFSRAERQIEILENNKDKNFVGAHAFMRGIQKAFLEADEPRIPNPKKYSAADTRDLILMERHSKKWTYKEFVTWVMNGHKKIRSGESYIRAFAPVRLLPGASASRQLASAYFVASQINLSWPERLLNGLLRILETTTFYSSKNLEFHNDIWVFLSYIEPPSKTVSVARRYLNRIVRNPEVPRETTAKLTKTICSAVKAASSKGGSNLDFLIMLAKLPHGLNDRELAVDIVDNWLLEKSLGHPETVSKPLLREYWIWFIVSHKDIASMALDMRFEDGNRLILELWKLLSDHEIDGNPSSNRERKRIIMEFSQETIEAVELDRSELLQSQSIETFETLEMVG